MIWTTRPRSDVGGLSAIVRGSGPHVLLLHGVGLRAEAWGAQLDLPGALTAPDMPGHGLSPFSGPFTMESYVAEAQSVLTSLDGPAIVIGHSMGAMLALELASRVPDRVRGVAALNAVFERSAEAARAVQARANALDGETVPDPGATLQRWFADAETPERAACEDWLRSVHPAAYKSAYTAFAHSQIPARGRLKALTCPALFMTGAQEPNSTPAMSRAMADLVPAGRAIIVEGAAHMMPMTHAAKVNSALAAFFSEVAQ